MVIPRTSEQEHKLYLYLREVVRQGTERAPEAILYNLLHARSPEARGLRTGTNARSEGHLERLTGRPIEPEALAAAIAEGNAARQAIRGLLRQREGPAPKLTGCGSAGADRRLVLHGSQPSTRCWREKRFRKSRRGRRFEGRGFCSKARRSIAPDICAAIEAHGAIVVAEDDWWGSRAAGQDIDITAEPIRAIFEKYYFDAPSPRVFPAAIADAWFHRKASEVDGVIFYLPPEDDVIGWDYPRLRAHSGRARHSSC